MDASAILVVISWIFIADIYNYILDDASSDDPPEEIPGNAEEINNELHTSYGHLGMSENIRLFIQNGHIYVYYESLNGVKVWQSVKIQHGWSVRKGFQLMCYSWYNPDDSEIPKNLQILVFFDRGCLRLEFSSKSAHHDHGGVGDYNVVRLVKISIHPYFGPLGNFPGQQTTMQQYFNDDSVFFVSLSKWKNRLFFNFQEYYVGEKFDQHWCRVVLPLSSNVQEIEFVEIQQKTQWFFFDLWGKLLDLYFDVRLIVKTTSQEQVFVTLSLIPPSVLENLDDDDIGDDLRVYRQDSEACIFDCVPRTGSKLIGFVRLSNNFLTDQEPGRLHEIFPVE
jgi:hypothetical protein